MEDKILSVEGGYNSRLGLAGRDYMKINQLKQLIAKYDKQYYEDGVSDISDAEYDRLYDEYLAFEDTYPELKEMEDTPTRRVGAGDEAGSTTLLPKFTHHSPLLSINKKAKTLEALKEFYESIGGDGVEVIIEPKLDGITCNINYQNGLLMNAATRGNGYVGDLITENFKNTDTLYPETLPGVDLEIRGEAIIPYDFFKENLSKDYSNPRNAVAGIMRSINPEDVVGKGICVMFYDIGQTSMKLENSDLSNLYHISELAFQTVPVISVSTWNDLKDVVESKMNGVIQEVDGFNVLMTDGKFPQAVCDGLVIKVNDTKLREKIGMTEKGPKWAFAYKFKPLQAVTRIDHIEWQTGKSGKITPVAVFDEISLGGTKITRATLNNIDYMNNLPVLYERRDVWFIESYDNWSERVDISYTKPIERIEYMSSGDVLRDSYTNQFIEVEFVDKNILKNKEVFQSVDGQTFAFEKDRYYLFNKNIGIQIDDAIVVERSNDVIPRIVAIHHHNNSSKLRELFKLSIDNQINSFKTPTKCPVCGHSVKQIGPQIFCQNPNCSAQLLGKLEQFVSRDAMNIVGLGSSILEVFIHEGYISTLIDIYNLEKYKEGILQLDKFGVRKYNNLIKSIENSKKCTLQQFIYALSIPLVGKKTSKDIAETFKTLDKFLDTTYEELIHIEDISGMTADSIMNYLQDEGNRRGIQELQRVLMIEEIVESLDRSLEGKTFVITGTLENPRKFYQDAIEAKGGKVSGSVSKKTYAVLIGENAGSKEAKARQLVENGTDILLLDSEQKIKEFLEL